MMKKFLYLLTISLAFHGCANEDKMHTKANLQQEVKPNNNRLQDNRSVSAWLSEVITDYLNSEDPKTAFENLQEALTTDYYNYKMDAINLEYSDMSIRKFENKWKSKYDTKYVGKGGFFISAQDNGKVKVTLCKFVETHGDTAKVFQTVVHDNRWNTDDTLNIKVIHKDNKLLIDDVRKG